MAVNVSVGFVLLTFDSSNTLKGKGTFPTHEAAKSAASAHAKAAAGNWAIVFGGAGAGEMYQG
jgi:hypothetical protein